ncbi:MAG: hypothetical protein AAGC67_00960 [Myxococcota bacterium]
MRETRMRFGIGIDRAARSMPAIVLCCTAIVAIARAEATPREDRVRIPAGPFLFGCNAEVDSLCDPSEPKAETLELAAFSIDRHEVRVEDDRACVRAGGGMRAARSKVEWAAREAAPFGPPPFFERCFEEQPARIRLQAVVE